MIALSVYLSIITQICLLLVQKNLRHFLNKSDAKLKPITTLVARVFPRFSGQNGCFTCSSYWLLKLFLFFWSAFEISLILPSVIQSKSAMIDRLDFRCSLVSGLRSPRGEERGLIFPSLSDTLYTDALIHCLSQYNRAYLIHCITHWAQIIPFSTYFNFRINMETPHGSG